MMESAALTTQPTMTYHYVWLVWSSAFLLPWALLYALFPQHRSACGGRAYSWPHSG